MAKGSTPVRYRSPDEDSARWLEFEFRAGDIVISTRSKSGTTWMQMICALLVFQTPDLPAPLAACRRGWTGSSCRGTSSGPTSPASSTAGSSRPTPRSTACRSTRGRPTSWWPATRSTWPSRSTTRATTSTAGRIAELTGQPRTGRIAAAAPAGRTTGSPAGSSTDADPRDELDSLPGVLRHLSDAWAAARRAERRAGPLRRPVATDLAGEMRRIAGAPRHRRARGPLARAGRGGRPSTRCGRGPTTSRPTRPGC